MNYSNHSRSAADIISESINTFAILDEWGDPHIQQTIATFEAIAEKLKEDDYWVEITQEKEPDYIGQTLCKLSWVDENWKLQHICFFKLREEPL